MTREETAVVVAMIRLRWPHSNAGDNLDAIVGLWAHELAEFSREEVEASVRRIGRGREHAPTLDVLIGDMEEQRQGEAPSFEDAMSLLARSRFARCLPYTPAGPNPPEDLVVALENLTRAGAPEVLLRFVAAIGVYALRMLPDPSQFALDPNQRAVRRDAQRLYAERVVPAWRRDPRPGLALGEAVRRFGPCPPEKILEPAPRRRRELPEPPAAEDTGDPFVGPERVARLLAERS